MEQHIGAGRRKKLRIWRQIVETILTRDLKEKGCSSLWDASEHLNIYVRVRGEEQGKKQII
jgi:hypothetical protein